MRTLLATCLMTIVFACAHRDAGQGFLKLSGSNGADPFTEESLDSTFYIGYVDYFPETREFYTALFYREGHEYPDEDLLQAKLDSVILLDDDWGRERLPIEEARKLLVLTGLDTLAIFNRQHELICISPLTRIEYLWNGMESYFIAVYSGNDNFTEQTEELYGITSAHAWLIDDSFTANEFSDPQLNEYLLKAMKANRNLSWDMRHYRINPAQTTYSVLSSFSPEVNEGSSYLTLLENNVLHVLNQEVNNYHFLNILPVPIHVNGKPLLLITCGYPGSDVLWDFLASYDGAHYEAMDYNRVDLKEPDLPSSVTVAYHDRE